MRYKDTSGDDNFVGTSADDVFKIRFGGRDLVDGGAGIDRLTVDYSSFFDTWIGANDIYFEKNGLSGSLGGLQHEGDLNWSDTNFKNIEKVSFVGTPGDDIMRLLVDVQYGDRTVAIDLGGGHNSLILDFSGMKEAQTVDVLADGTVKTSVGTIAAAQSLYALLSEGDDIVTGTAGNDELRGLTGDDQLSGGDGKDTLDGSYGDDHLSGGAGNDSLFGDAGADTLSGGLGADVFHYLQKDAKDKSVDTILDFSHAEGDRIDLQKIDADKTPGHSSTFVFIDQQAFTGPGGEHGEIRQQVNGDGTVTLEADRNHDGKADFSILIHTDVPLVAADLVL